MYILYYVYLDLIACIHIFMYLSMNVCVNAYLYLDLYRPVSAAQGIQSLRFAERGVLVVQFARTASMKNRPFSGAGPRVWNDLPQELRLFPRLCTDTFI